MLQRTRVRVKRKVWRFLGRAKSPAQTPFRQETTVQERPDIFSDWEDTLDEMRQALDRIESLREASVQDEEEPQPDDS
jgi:hypothetical protein